MKKVTREEEGVKESAESMTGFKRKIKEEDLDDDDVKPLEWIRVEKRGESVSPRGSPKWGVESLEPLELPQFTATVKKALRDGESATVWTMVSYYQMCLFINFNTS